MRADFWTRLLVPAAFVGAVLLSLPSLTSPLLQDDVVHRAMLTDGLPGLHWGPLELYDFVGSPTRPASALRDAGALPWFVSEELTLRFFRPLSSATLALDWYLFGNRLWPARLHSLCWFLVLLAVATVLYRRFLPAVTAGLAALIFAVSIGHLMPVAWLAARHTLVSAAFGLVAFWLHVRSREDGWKPGRALAPLALAVGLLAGELALGAFTLVVAWELTGRRDRPARRVAAVIPAALVVAGYLIFYSVMGYGARGSGVYVGPDSGLAGAVTVLRHFFMLVGELIAATPSDAFSLGSDAVQTAAALWGAAAAMVAWLVFRLARAHLDPRESRAMGWFSIAAAAAAFPGTFSLVGGRVLPLALVPAAGVVAIVLAGGLAAFGERGRRLMVRMFLAVAVLCFGIGHLLVAPALRVALASVLTTLARDGGTLAARTPACGGNMVVIAASDPSVATYLAPTLVLQGRAPQSFRVLSMASADHRIENVTPTGFDVRVPVSEAGRTIWERLYRDRGVRAGDRVATRRLDVTVVEAVNGAATRTRFDFGEPLGSPAMCFVVWRGGSLVTIAAPEPGAAIDVPHEPGPMGW
jgi:hypothetical protein